VSYTLRGRLESRLGASLVPAIVAALLAVGLHRWWPVEVAALMVGVGLVLDLAAYDRLLDYQPGWAALPLGAVELGIVMALAHQLRLGAPVGPAVALFGGSWLLAQILGQAGYPLLRLSYGDDGGELGRAGPGAAVVVAAVFLAAGGVAWATMPPTVTLAAGAHEGPLVIDRAVTLVGRPGAFVSGGIVIRADDVTIRDVTVIGGENGIDVDLSHRVRLERVHVLNSTMDGIHVRRSEVAIRDCTVAVAGPRYTQGIDISFSMDRHMSSVTGCDIDGGAEGIVTHSSMVMVEGNRVHGTSLRGIAMVEMSMGEIHGNHVSGGLGVGIFCGDRSECEVQRNLVSNTRPDGADDSSRVGVGIESDFESVAALEDNVLVGNPVPTAAFAGARFERR
jgi:nitrous oxidase accessory protein NosD